MLSSMNPRAKGPAVVAVLTHRSFHRFVFTIVTILYWVCLCLLSSTQIYAQQPASPSSEGTLTPLQRKTLELVTISDKLTLEGRSEEAVQALEMHLKDLLAEPVPYQPAVLHTIFCIARLQIMRGDLNAAEARASEGMALLRKIESEIPPPIRFMYLETVADLLIAQTKYKEAAALLETTMQHIELLEPIQQLGKLTRLAQCYYNLGDRRVTPTLDRAMEVTARFQLEGSEFFLTALTMQSAVAAYTGDYETMKQKNRLVRELTQRRRPPNHPDIAFNNLQTAQDLAIQGDKRQAHELVAQAEAMAMSWEDPSFTAHKMATLLKAADVFGGLNDYTSALRCVDNAVPLATDYQNAHFSALCLYNAGNYYLLLGHTEKAEPCLLRAKAIYEEYLGPDHAGTAYCLFGIGRLYLLKGEPVIAKQYFLQSIDVGERAVPDDPQLSYAYYYLSLACLDAGDLTTARTSILTANDLRRKSLTSTFKFSNEREKWHFANKFEPYAPLVGLGDPALIADELLSNHGLTLETVLRERRLQKQAERDSGTRNLVIQIKELRRRLQDASLAALQGTGSPVSPVTRLELGRALEDAERKLMRLRMDGGADFAAPLDYRSVQEWLQPGELLVHYVIFKRHVGNGKLEDHVGLLVMDDHGLPNFTDLGKREFVDHIVQVGQKLARGDFSLSDSDMAAIGAGKFSGKNDLMQKYLSTAYRTFLMPVHKLRPLDSQKRISFVLDGPLHLVPFELLLESQKATGDRQLVASRLGSARDLLPQSEADPVVAAKHIVVFAGPAFTSNTAHVQENADGYRNVDLLDLAFGQLPGALQEAEILKIFGRHTFSTVQVYFGEQASERNINSIRSPWILHLATHGFYMPGDEENGRSSDPMYASGLALAQAQDTVQAWREGKAVTPGNDGIVCAAELSLLDLRKTELLVLSACESGNGSTQVGDGVIGLQRAATIAGARNLLLTLWQVNDTDTLKFMTYFYDYLREDKAPEACSQARAKLFRELTSERGVYEAVKAVGPFVITQTRR